MGLWPPPQGHSSRAAPLPLADASTDLSKMRVSQLKQILESKGEKCRECVEKGDYIARIRQAFGVNGGREEL